VRRSPLLSVLAVVVGGCLAGPTVVVAGSAGAATRAAVTTIEGVDVAGAPGSAPAVTLTTPFSVKKTVSAVVSPGDGAATKPGQVVVVD